MELRYESVTFPIKRKYRLLHISDVHFSKKTKHDYNLRLIGEILALAETAHHPVPGDPEHSTPVDAVCITGDLVSRNVSDETLDDAVLLFERLRELLKEGLLFYSLGNHESDLPEDVRTEFFDRLRESGVYVLDNESQTAYFSGSGEQDGIRFTGLTLPGSVYHNDRGGYWKLAAITRKVIKNCVGPCENHPCILLAHNPVGLSAYAKWGADLVLSGHIHGGIIRIRDQGILSPERRFLPKYTKGLMKEGRCTMNISAGIGKFRVNNPAEIVCIDLKPASEEMRSE